MHTMDSDFSNDLSDFIPPEEAIYSRMTSPVDTTFVDIEKIGFTSVFFFFFEIIPCDDFDVI